MAKYKLQIKPSAAKELDRLPKKDLQKVVKKIQSLASDPRPVGCEKLSGEETVEGIQVTIVAIGWT